MDKIAVVWNENCKNDKEDTKIYFKLIQVGLEKNISDIYLVICDKNGEMMDSKVLLAIDVESGLIIKIPFLDKDIPLKTDVAGRVIVTDIFEIEEVHEKYHMNMLKKKIAEEIKEKEAKKIHTLN